MKRIRLLILLGMVAVALPLGLLQGLAKAAGGSTTTTDPYVSISQYADFNFGGTQLDVNLLVRCTSVTGLGLANVSVTQYQPETGGPETGGPATGDGENIRVVCDGKTHSVGVTVVGTLYDPGKALATAEVTAVTAGGKVTASTTKWITIKVV
jgi:hypothetical protein